jgi:hydrogenase expression/formation protein HypE
MARERGVRRCRARSQYERPARPAAAERRPVDPPLFCPASAANSPGWKIRRRCLKSARIAFTTDSYVVRPLFFPGGDIGKLAVCGTINDLAVGGARPLFLSAAFILEEGLALTDLERIVASMRRACDEAGVALVTGDTKVVDRGKGDQVFITTSGIGIVPDGVSLSIHAARPGDRVLVSGTVGDHGVAILSVRKAGVRDGARERRAPLGGLGEAILEACPAVRRMATDARSGGAAE